MIPNRIAYVLQFFSLIGRPIGLELKRPSLELENFFENFGLLCFWKNRQKSKVFLLRVLKKSNFALLLEKKGQKAKFTLLLVL